MNILYSKPQNINKLEPTTINIDALKQLRDQLIKEQPKIRMAYYASTVDAKTMCATSCCLAGWGLEWKIGTTPELDAEWASRKTQASNLASVGWAYTNRLFGTTNDCLRDTYFNWLFHSMWNNDLNLGIERLNYIIENGTVPAVFFIQDDVTHSSISLVDLMSQLDQSTLITSTTYEIPSDYVLVSLGDTKIVGSPELLEETLPQLPLDKESDTVEYFSTIAILLHKDDIPKFNQLLQPAKST